MDGSEQEVDYHEKSFVKQKWKDVVVFNVVLQAVTKTNSESTIRFVKNTRKKAEKSQKTNSEFAKL